MIKGSNVQRYVNATQSDPKSTEATKCKVRDNIWALRSSNPVLIVCMVVGVAIAHADRSNMSTAIIPMSEEYGWNVQTEGAILGSFFYGYVLTQIIGGILSDQHGGQPVLAVGMFAWSFCTAITPEAARLGLPFLVTVRFLMGVGEGVTFSALHSMIVDCISPRWQSTAASALTSGASIGMLIGFGSCPSLIHHFGWASVFYVFALAGFIYLPIWMFLNTNPSKKYNNNSRSASNDCITGEINDHSDQTAHSLQLNGISPTTTSEQPLTVNGNHEVSLFASAAEIETASANCNLTSTAEGLASFEIYREPTVYEDNNQSERNTDFESAQLETQLEAQQPKECHVAKNTASEKNTVLQSLQLCWVLLSFKEVWAIIIAQFCLGWVQFAVLTWLPRLIQDRHTLEQITDLSLLIALPASVQAIIGLLIGPIGDALIHKFHFSKPTVRHGFQALAMIPPAILFLSAYYSSTALQMSIYITAALAFMGCRGVAVLVAQQDIAPQCAGLLFGIGNTANIISAMISTPLTGAIRHHTGSWKLAFWLFSCAGTKPILDNTSKAKQKENYTSEAKEERCS